MSGLRLICWGWLAARLTNFLNSALPGGVLADSPGIKQDRALLRLEVCGPHPARRQDASIPLDSDDRAEAMQGETYRSVSCGWCGASIVGKDVTNSLPSSCCGRLGGQSLRASFSGPGSAGSLCLCLRHAQG